MAASGADGGEGETTHHSYRSAAGRDGSVSELALIVEAPAIQGARSRDATRVIRAGGKSAECHTSRNGHWNQAPRVEGPGTEFARRVAAPAVGGATRIQGAGVLCADCNVDEAQPTGDGHWNRTIGRRSVTQLPRRVAAPAIGGARRREAARKASARGEKAETQSAGDCGRQRQVGRCSIAGRRAPAQRTARSRQTAVVPAAYRQERERHSTRYRHRHAAR